VSVPNCNGLGVEHTQPHGPRPLARLACCHFGSPRENFEAGGGPVRGYDPGHYSMTDSSVNIIHFFCPILHFFLPQLSRLQAMTWRHDRWTSVCQLRVRSPIPACQQHERVKYCSHKSGDHQPYWQESSEGRAVRLPQCVPITAECRCPLNR
jgi:hypothetical protein